MSRKITRPHVWRQGPLPSPRDPAKGWATRNEEINDGNVLWRQYIIFVDLYRYYIDLIWKVTIWYYTAVGLSLAYLFSHLSGQNHSYLPLLLIFLSALSVGIALIFLRVVFYVSQMGEWLDYISVSLGLPGRPHVEFIRWFCRFTGATLLLIAVACLGLFVYLHA